MVNKKNTNENMAGFATSTLDGARSIRLVQYSIQV